MNQKTACHFPGLARGLRYLGVKCMKGRVTRRRFLAAAGSAALGLTGMATLGASRAQAKSLVFTLDAVPDRANEAQAIVAQLHEAGIGAEVRIWERAALLDQIRAGDRAAYTTDWGSAWFDPFDLAIPKLKTGDRGNFSFYSNADVDTAFAAASTTADQAVRRRALLDVQRIVFKDAPWIFGYVAQNIEASSAALTGWTPSADNGEILYPAAVRGGDTVTVGMRADSIVTLDPAMYRDRDTEAVLRNIYDGLLAHTPAGKIVPQLATSWTRVRPTEYVFTLRGGVRFHNGDPLTADDVVFTFERVIAEGGVEGKSSPRKGLLGPITQAQKIDDLHVRFTLGAPFPENLVLEALRALPVVPQKYFQRVGEAGFTARPVGSGPFAFAQGALNSQIILRRNDAYWAGPAKLRQVVFRMMPEPATRIAALLAGEVQIIQEVPPDLVGRLSGSPDVAVKTVDGTRSFEIELNNKKAPFDDARVRQALNYAVNWDAILKNIYHGYGKRLATAFLPSGFGYDGSLRPYPYNPAKAKELLAAAGYGAGA